MRKETNLLSDLRKSVWLAPLEHLLPCFDGNKIQMASGIAWLCWRGVVRQ